MPSDRMALKRRRLVQTIGLGAGASMVGLAGCLGDDDDDDDGDDTTPADDSDSADDSDDADDGDDSPTDDYPTGPIDMIVPFATGSGSDAYGRTYADALSDILDVNIGVTNIDGAGAMNGLQELAGSDPDGYTIGNGVLPGNVINYVLQDADFPMDELSVICSVAADSQVIFANPDHDLEGDFVGLNERYGDGEFINFGGGAGGIQATAMVMRDDDAFEFTYENYIGYDGTGQTMEALAADEIPAALGVWSAAEPFMDDDLVEPVAFVGTAGRDIAPDIPVPEDDGYPNLDHIAVVSRPFWAPPGLPDEQLQVLEDAFAEAVETDSVIQWAEDAGNEITFTPHADAQPLLEDAFAVAQDLDLDEI